MDCVRFARLDLSSVVVSYKICFGFGVWIFGSGSLRFVAKILAGLRARSTLGLVLDLWYLAQDLVWGLCARSKPVVFALDLGLGSHGLRAVFLCGICQEFAVWALDLGADPSLAVRLDLVALL